MSDLDFTNTLEVVEAVVAHAGKGSLPHSWYGSNNLLNGVLRSKIGDRYLMGNDSRDLLAGFWLRMLTEADLLAFFRGMYHPVFAEVAAMILHLSQERARTCFKRKDGE